MQALKRETAGVPDEKPLPDLMMASYHEAIGWNAYRKALLAALVQPAAHDQGEVQRLREALGDAAQSLETISNGAGLDEFMKDASDARCYARSRAGVARAALAASTGQEVG